MSTTATLSASDDRSEFGTEMGLWSGNVASSNVGSNGNVGSSNVVGDSAQKMWQQHRFNADSDEAVQEFL